MRGSVPGERRGGRQKGTPNRATVDVRERLAELGCDPIEGMALIAMNPDNAAELRGRMYAELAGYVAPKRRAVEVTQNDAGPVSVSDAVAKVRARIAGIAARQAKTDG